VFALDSERPLFTVMFILQLLSPVFLCASIAMFVFIGGGFPVVEHYALLSTIAIALIAMSVGCLIFVDFQSMGDKTSTGCSSPVDRYLPLIWLLMSCVLLARYGVSTIVGNLPERLDAGGHWAGIPTSLSVTLQSWCWWTIGLSIVMTASKFTRSMIVVVGYILFAIIACQLILGSIAMLGKHTVIFGIAIRDNVDVFSGSFINRNNYAYFIATALPFSLSCVLFRAGSYITPKTIVTLFIVSLCFASMVWSQSRVGTVSTIMSTTVWLWFYLKTRQVSSRRLLLSMLAVCIFILLILLAADPESLVRRFQKLGSTDVRFDMLQAAFDIPLTNWLLGIGAGNVAIVLHQFLPPDMSPNYIQYLHNDFLQFALEQGIVVTVLLGSMLGLLALNAKRETRNLIRSGAGCGLLGTGIGAIVDFPLHVPSISLLFCFLCGVVLNSNLSRNRSASRRNQSS